MHINGWAQCRQRYTIHASLVLIVYRIAIVASPQPIVCGFLETVDIGKKLLCII